ncbi:patatin-like phospholipase family protein [Pyxidicoccus sp. 3LG]
MPRACLFACAAVVFLAVPASAQEPDAGSAPDAGAPVEDTRKVYMGTEFPAENAANPIAAQEATEQSAPALVVSGGISLGAYQAGFISTLVRFWSVARRDGADVGLGNPAPRVWTGASAGAVNALLGGLASCDPAFAQERWSPEQSLFWTVWVKELDLDLLLPKDDEDRGDHLFSAPHMERTLALIEKQAAETRFREDCSFAFGITVTNLRGRDVPFGWGGPESKAQLKRVTEKLVVQVSTGKDGKLTARMPFVADAPGANPPYIALDPEERLHYPALSERPERVEGGQPVSLKSLLLTPQASGAFPLAFPPVPVSVSFFDEGQWGPLQALRLVDGGFLNNNPLDLAVRLGARWVEGAEPSFNRSRFPVVYLDQDVVDWKWAKPPPPPEGSLSPLEATYLQHAGTVMRAAQDSVVLDTLEHDANLSGRVKIPRRGSVLPSEFQFAMMGFFDRRFRQHDFYRGMQDAIRFLSTQLTSMRAVEVLVPRVPDEPVVAREARVREVLGISSEGFRCMAEGVCDGEGAGDQLRRLRQAMDALTARAKQGELKDGDVDDLLGALGDAGYFYSDGIMGRAQASGTRNDLMAARNRIGGAFHDLVSHQKGGLRVALRPAGAAFLDDWLTYSPPRHAVTLHLSRQRGLGVGVEAPIAAFEDRPTDGVYDRSELRLGGELSALGVRDMDQLTANKTRFRWATLGAYADWVSDMDGFSGRVKLLQAGPFVRLRLGLGTSGSYLSKPDEFAFNLLEARLGVDLMEKVGLRLAMPLYLLKVQGGEVHHGTPKFIKETDLGVEVLFTWW